MLMSILRDALERIFHWFQVNHPKAISSLVPGLSSSEIDKKLSDLPFQVPQKVREIYKLSNGLDEQIFDHLYLLSLESAIQEAKTWVDETYEEIAEMYKYTGKAIFPIFQIEGNFLAVVETKNERDPSPIVHLSHAGGIEISLKYANLTAMLLTIAESYETGGFFIGRNGHVEQDEKKYAAAYRNHNSGICELALKRFLDTLPVDSDSEPIQLLHGDLCLINGYGIEIPSSPLKSEVVNTLSNLLEDEQYDSGFTVILALEELRAVDALIQGLRHPDKWVRSRAAFTLGKIKAFEAVEFVSQLLEDPDPIVQEAVHEALEMFRSER
jgi:HEAT repeats/SMI1 / KNR4 family (SUKH-1)